MTGVREETLSLVSNPTNQQTSKVAWAMALYYAFEDDIEVVLCFFDFQLIGEVPSSIP